MKVCDWRSSRVGFRGHLFKSIHASGTQQKAGSGRSKCTRGRSAKTAGSSGDQHPFIREIKFHVGIMMSGW